MFHVVEYFGVQQKKEVSLFPLGEILTMSLVSHIPSFKGNWYINFKSCTIFFLIPPNSNLFVRSKSHLGKTLNFHHNKGFAFVRITGNKHG